MFAEGSTPESCGKRTPGTCKRVRPVSIYPLCYTSSWTVPSVCRWPICRMKAAVEFMPVVELSGVTKAYENKVDDNTRRLSIDAGRIFGFLGPKEAGKTSSIRMMMDITIPDTGRISLFGKPFD